MKLEKLLDEIRDCTQEDWNHTAKVLKESHKQLIELKTKLDEVNHAYEILGKKLDEDKKRYSAEIVTKYSVQWLTKADGEWVSVTKDGKHLSFKSKEDAEKFLEESLENAKKEYCAKFKEYATNPKSKDYKSLDKLVILKTRIIERRVSEWSETDNSVKEIEAPKMKEFMNVQ